MKDFYTDRLTGESGCSDRGLTCMLVQRLQHHPGHRGQIFCQPDHGKRGYGGSQGVLPEKRHTSDQPAGKRTLHRRERGWADGNISPKVIRDFNKYADGDRNRLRPGLFYAQWFR